MKIERLVALFVSNDDLYNKYRENMLPILESYGGGFGYDFTIAEVLKSKVNEPINRVFTIYFKNEKAMDDFFNDEQYLKIRKQYYEPAVSAIPAVLPRTVT